MVKKNVLLAMGIVMFILTTSLLILVPSAIPGPLNMDQKVILIGMCTLGYWGTGMYLYVYSQSSKNQDI